MDRVLPSIWRYRWEIALLAIALIAAIGAIRVDNSGIVWLAASLVLAFLLPGVLSQRRALLTVLWVAMLGVSALLVIPWLLALREFPFGTEGIGLLLTVAAVTALLVIIGTAPRWAWKSRRLWQYRWEALPLVTALLAAQAWRLLPRPDRTGAQFGSPDIGFYAATNGIAVAVLALGFAWSLWRGPAMATGLWAVVLVHRVVLLIIGPASGFLFWPPPAATFISFVMMLALHLPAVALVALVTWKLGTLGRRHALLIAAGYLAWTYVPYIAPWHLEPQFSDSSEYALATARLVLWMGAVGGLVVAFHHFPRWEEGRQRQAVMTLVMLAMAAQLLASVVLFLWQYNAAGGQGLLDLLRPGFRSFYNYVQLGSALLNGALLLAATGLITRNRPSVTREVSSG